MGTDHRASTATLPAASLVRSFVDHRRSDLACLLARLQEGDYETIAILGHRMRGSAPSYGFPELAALGERLEAAALERNADDVRREAGALAAWLGGVDTITARPESGTHPRAARLGADEPGDKNRDR